MSLLHCDKCGAPWSEHENCDDDQRPKIERQQTHIEQLKSEMVDDRKEIEAWHKKFLLFGSTPQEAATAIARRMTALTEKVEELREAHGGAIIAQGAAVDRAENLERKSATIHHNIRDAINAGVAPTQREQYLLSALRTIRYALQRQSETGCSCYSDPGGDCSYCNEGIRIESTFREILGPESET